MPRLRTWIFVLALIGLPATMIGVYRLWDLHPVLPNGKSLPYGFDVLPDNFTPDQDFAYNQFFYRAISSGQMAHPYRLKDQQELIEKKIPNLPYGLPHAYSPVALILMQPFLFLPQPASYLIDVFLSYLIFLLFLRTYLLKRAENEIQALTLVPCLLSFAVITSFTMGQTSLFTTPILGLFWMLAQRRFIKPSWTLDFALAVLAWIVCAKPSVAFIPLAFLLGCRLWRVLFLCGFLLGSTWLLLGPLYGGWITGLQDYATLLGGYCTSGMTPFFRGCFDLYSNTSLQAFVLWYYPQGQKTTALFHLMRDFNLLGYTLLILARWTGRLSPQIFFYALIWNFLLLCPYLLSTEDWLLCLFVVGNPFFRPAPGVIFKILLVFGIMNGRVGILLMWPVFFPCKLILFAWWILELYQSRHKEEAINLKTAISAA